MKGPAAGPASAAGATLEQAVALHRAGRLFEAEVQYRSALGVLGKHFEVLHRLGVCLHQSGKLAEAARFLEQAVKRNPTAALAHLSLAETQRALRDNAAALTSYRRAALLAPGDPLVFLVQGVALEGLGRYSEAQASYGQALLLDGGNVDALVGQSNCHLMMGEFAAAIAGFERVLAARPDHGLAACNRAVALTQTGRPAEALAVFDALLSTRPDDAPVLSNRGNALFALDRLDEALQCQDRALALAPDLESAQMSRAAALNYLNRLDAAIAQLDRVLAAHPEHADAHRDRALLLLKQGAYAEGWLEFEWRAAGSRRLGAANLQAGRAAPRPLRAGEARGNLAGRTVLVCSEQGHGDTLHMVRYVPLLAAAGARVVLRVQPALVSLLRRLPGTVDVIPEGSQAGPADLVCPLMSLPMAFGTTPADIPAALPYLAADPQRVATWRARLGGAQHKRIGIAWSGSAGNTNDHRRSIALERWLPLLQSGPHFLALQPDLRDADCAALEHLPLEFFGQEIADFEDTAALIALCDLVICVDTAVAHLAGAMNKPLWILVPYAPDWRWMMERSDSPWYPCARLFRQGAPGDWDGVFAAVLRALGENGRAAVPHSGAPAHAGVA